MANAQLDDNGDVCGLFAVPQSFSIEIDDDDPRVAAFNARIAASAPAPSCALWQLEAVLTADQWAQIQAAIAAMNNPALSAFAAHGSNMIPADSTTLIALGAAIGLTAAQVAALVAEAAAVAIP